MAKQPVPVTSGWVSNGASACGAAAVCDLHLASTLGLFPVSDHGPSLYHGVLLLSSELIMELIVSIKLIWNWDVQASR